MAAPLKCPTCGRAYACVTRIKHWRSGKTLKAEDYGLKCFPIRPCGHRS